MKIKIVLLLAVLLILVSPICKNQGEGEGQCTACSALDILVSGRCYPKIRGCMNYTIGPVCAQCQNGYVLSRGTCIREAVYYNQNNSQYIPPSVSIVETLTLDQIKLIIGEQYGSYFTDAHEKFISQHNQLGKGAIKSVEKLQTKKGTFFIIIYQSASGQKYEATGYLNQANLVKQFSYLPLGTQRKDPNTANTLLLQIQGANLTGYSNLQIKLLGDNYTFDYINPALAVTRIKFNRNDIGSALSTKLVVTKLNVTDLAKQALQAEYPIYGTRKVTKINRIQDYHIFTYSTNWTASVRFNNNRFQVNRPVAINSYAIDYNGIQSYVPWSSYLKLKDWKDPKYLACLQAATDIVPQIATYSVATVNYSPMLQGTLYLIDAYKGLSTYYSIWAIYTVDNTVAIIDIDKDSLSTYTLNYDYNSQPNFLKWYNISMVASKVLTIPAIKHVICKNMSNVKYHKVVYSANQYMQFQYNQTSMILKLISYVVDGEDLLPIINAAGPTDFKQQPQILLNYLKKTSYTSPFSFMQSFFNSTLGPILTWVTNLGTQSANLRPDTNSIAVDGLQQVSAKTCFDVQNWESNNKIIEIDNYLRSYYNLNGYELELAQNKVNNVGNRYRLLYSGLGYKQIQFVVQQLYTLLNVIKSTILNNGYAVVEPVTTNIDYQAMVSYLLTTGLTGTRMPMLTQNTNKYIRGYYDDGTNTQQIIITKTTNAVTSTTIDSRAYLLVPEGFKIQALLVPGTPGTTDQNYINQCMAVLLAKPQCVGATLAYADKQTNGYNLLLKTPTNSYIRTTCNMINSIVTVTPTTPTSYSSASFSNCEQYASTGKCVGCNADTQSQYQGQCWNKMEGCMVQAGKICLRCMPNYVIDHRICKIACNQFSI